MMDLKEVYNWVLARLGEASTWAGIAYVAGAISTSLGSGAGWYGALAAAIVAIAKKG